MRPGDKSSPGLRCQGLVRIDSISIIPTQDHPRSRQTPAAFLLVSKSKAARGQIIATLTPEWFRSATWQSGFPPPPETLGAPQVLDIYSVSDCVNDNFADYVDYWKHNGWWFFDSPDVIQSLSRKHSIDLGDTHLFYYEVYELEFNEGHWRSFSQWEDSWKETQGIIFPIHKELDGYDVVTFWVENSPNPEHSPLSCNGVARELHANAHCLFETFDEALNAVNTGRFDGCERGALRIFAVYSVDWPQGAPTR
jgi:hypothetical protein